MRFQLVQLVAERVLLVFAPAWIGCREPPTTAGISVTEDASAWLESGSVSGSGSGSDSGSDGAEGTPRGLACLVAHYGGTVERTTAGWALTLPDGRRVAWDDGRQKTFDQTLDGPDLKDTLAIAYTAGPIAPITTKDHDPGRIRVSELFEATYGASREAVRAALVPWTFRGRTLLVHRRAESAFRKAAARLEAVLTKAPSLAPFFEDMGGTFIWRPIAGTNRPSAHSFGISLDLNPARAHYWRNDPKAAWKNSVPQEIVDAFEAEGFAWGGRWFHYDTMHFEWRPELFDPSCR